MPISQKPKKSPQPANVLQIKFLRQWRIPFKPGITQADAATLLRHAARLRATRKPEILQRNMSESELVAFAAGIKSHEA